MKVAGWDLDDPQYLAVCDNNRVFFECLLEQVIIIDGLHTNMIIVIMMIIVMVMNDRDDDQAYAERNTEGLEERTWEQALAPRFLYEQNHDDDDYDEDKVNDDDAHDDDHDDDIDEKKLRQY